VNVTGIRSKSSGVDAIIEEDASMSDIVTQAVAVLNEKLSGAAFSGTAKFDITGEGCVMMDASGARAGDEPADVTLTADADTFQSILEGETNPTSAFMSGKLAVDGDMGMAMQLASALA
jgi:putative sterol carrier protein